MKKISFEKMEILNGGIKFWGTELSYPIDDDPSCPSGQRANIYEDYYVFGIRTSHNQITTGPCVEP